jgi:outer membrane beta-barrel protein
VDLEKPPYQYAPAAYRYLASALVGVEYAPIYAKMSVGARKVVHYDVYGAARLGATIEQSVLPDGAVTAAPTLGLGIGGRFFVNQGMAVRFEIYDDLLVENRTLTRSWHFKQNAGVQLGVSFFPGSSGAKGRK